MKKLLLTVAGLASYPFLAVPALAQGVDPCTQSGENDISAALCKITGDNAGVIIRNIVVFIIVIAVIIAIIYLLYGGIKWVTSGGDKEKVESARNHITAAIVGLIIVFLSIFLVSVILSLFGINLGNLVLPKIMV